MPIRLFSFYPLILMADIDESKLHIIAFFLVTSRNRVARRNLLENHIEPSGLPGLSPALLRSYGFQDDEVERIKNRYLKAAEEELEKAHKHGIDFVFAADAQFPPDLREIYDPPPFLYIKGDKNVLTSVKIGVVGSRRGSSYGWLCLQNLVPDLCAAGLAIVSGMAYGIDSMAHKITVKENGKPIGVNAGGLLHLYPAGNIGLIERIIESGCVISEFSLDTVPRPFYFPIRNRIIAGISKAILVVEAAVKSGSLITARLGMEQGKDILAIPGRIDSPISRGTNYLIQQGAKLVANPGDILDEFGISWETGKNNENLTLSKKEKKILDLMEVNELKSIDYFVENLEFSVSDVISQLMGLILKNVVIEEAGGYRRIR